MIESIGVKELISRESPLEVLSKQYDMQSEKTLNQSVDKVFAKSILPRSNGEWTGVPGESTWKPNLDTIPKDKNHSNEEGKTWGEILTKYGVDGIPFKDGEPNFSEISRGTVEIKDFTDARFGAGGNFDQADEALAEKKGCTSEDVRQWRIENNFTWHERSDCKTMDKVPREIHHNISHSGGISKLKNQI